MPFAIGSDGPMNPFLNIMFAAMNPTNPSQALTVEQAVAAYTRGSAFAEFAERAQGDDRGRHARGHGAPVAGHLQDADQIFRKTASVLTIVNGRIV